MLDVVNEGKLELNGIVMVGELLVELVVELSAGLVVVVVGSSIWYTS